jgi:hypothetical protein
MESGTGAERPCSTFHHTRIPISSRNQARQPVGYGTAGQWAVCAMAFLAESAEGIAPLLLLIVLARRRSFGDTCRAFPTKSVNYYFCFVEEVKNEESA